MFVSFFFLKLQAFVLWLFISLCNVVRKLFFKIFHRLQLWPDSFHITHISSLGGFAFSLWSAWRYGDFWRIGDHQHFQMVLYIVTQQIIFWIRFVCYEWDIRSWRHSKPISVEGLNSQTYLCYKMYLDFQCKSFSITSILIWFIKCIKQYVKQCLVDRNITNTVFGIDSICALMVCRWCADGEIVFLLHCILSFSLPFRNHTPLSPPICYLLLYLDIYFQILWCVCDAIRDLLKITSFLLLNSWVIVLGRSCLFVCLVS